MAELQNSFIAAGLDVVRALGLELAFTEPGKDSGLLPVNSFILQLEELAEKTPLPAPIAVAVKLARARVDQVFDASATFDTDSIAWLAEWQAWMEKALERWAEDQPLPPVPVAWNAHALSTPLANPTEQGLPQSEGSNTILPNTPTSVPPTNPAVMGMQLNLDADRELLTEFINESQEHLQNIENGVLILEEDPTNIDTLNTIFRAFHTFKGSSGFLNLLPIQVLAHELESLLDAARQQKLSIDTNVINLILEGGDTLKQFVTQIASRLTLNDAGQPIQISTGPLITKVQSILADSSEPIAAPERSSDAKRDNLAVSPERAPSQEFPSPATQSAPLLTPPETQSLAMDSAPKGLSPDLKSDATERENKPTRTAAAATGSAGFVKVDMLKLDSLIDLVGELVISESMVVQDPELLNSPSGHLARNLAQLRRITSELQRTAMSLRMVPIRATFQKMNRLVRDLAAKQEKQITLVLSGEDTELDRNIVEEISDPLVHMIRNAADHGVEVPAARIAKGKPAHGTIHLRAFHRGGNIVIQIQDDGNGLNKDKLLAKARDKGIVKPGQSLSDKEIYALIFSAGFSTAEKVTDISGRGVGMDVVRRNIEKLRGKVDIDTVLGDGTTFTIYLPLTLAIIDGMIVSVGSERYIIPTLSVRESFRPKPEMMSTVHERGEMVNVRGRLCPLLRLYHYFDQSPKITNPTEGIVVVVESGQQTRCLLVDELIGKQEVVIKSLGGTMKRNAAIAGGAVLGDGRVGLILNVDALVKLSHVRSSNGSENV